jgi:hypothetical protein
VTGARRDTSAGDELAAIRAAAAMSVDSAGAAPPQQAKLGQNALNPEISVTGDLRAQSVSSAPHDDTFTAREFEVGFQSALDPYSTAKVFLAAEDGEISIEEGYAYFTALPLHLRLGAVRRRPAAESWRPALGILADEPVHVRAGERQRAARHQPRHRAHH